MGKHISPGRIGGYYNDFTRKADWRGISDDNGIPLNVLSNGKRVYFPITIAQMALANYDLWLDKGESKNKDLFLKLATWLKTNMDENGGLINPWMYLRSSAVSNYSGLAQGEAISVMIRAYELTKSEPFLDSCKKAYNLMLKPVEDGGCSVYSDGKIYIEEYPEIPRSTVLNGWIFASFGVYDLLIATGDAGIQEVYSSVLKSIEQSLYQYDSGSWSYYDLHGTIASPFYHSLLCPNPIWCCWSMYMPESSGPL